MPFDVSRMNLKPLHNRVMVERLQYTGPSLLIVPDMYKETSQFARVMAIGDKVKERKLLKRGAVILVPGVAAKFPDWEKQEFCMITEDDIGGIVDGWES